MAKDDVHVQIEKTIMIAVRTFAREHGISLAAAMSFLLKRGLDSEDRFKDGHE